MGMNSGSSFDGIDVILAEIEMDGDGFPKAPRFICGGSYDWPEEVTPIVRDAFENRVDMVGINNRNLTTFETDIYTSFRLASQVPVACLKVAESGIRAMETVVALRRLGFRGFLIGEHFMREAQPAQALKNFVGYAD